MPVPTHLPSVVIYENIMLVGTNPIPVYDTSPFAPAMSLVRVIVLLASLVVASALFASYMSKPVVTVCAVVTGVP